MKLKIITFLIFISTVCFSQNLEEKYDDSYGIFNLEFKIDKNGKATFEKVNMIKCVDCSEKLINQIKKKTKNSFYNSIKEYEKKYSSKVNGD